jgi:DNA polymerase-4
MHYILFLELERFYAAAGSLQVVFRQDPSSKTKLVLDASPEACLRGVTPGMSLIEAKTLLGQEGTYVPWLAENYRTATKTWLDLANEFTDVIEPLDQHQAFLNLSEQRDPDGLARLLVQRLETLGYGVRWGGAGSRWVAQTVAEVGDPQGLALIMPRRYVGGLGLARLKTVSPETRRRLSLLGYSRIGELLEVPRTSLQKQFGAEAFEIQRAAMGSGDSHVQALYPERCAQVRMAFAGALSDENLLRDALEILAKRLVQRLQAGDWVAKTIELSFEYEDGVSPIYTRTFTQPLADLPKIRRALELVAPWPPAEPPTAIKVRMPELERAKRRQADLGIPSNIWDDQSTEGHLQIQAAVKRLGQTFGEDSIRPAALESPRKRFIRAFKDACGWS